jgi:hypothetical protein
MKDHYKTHTDAQSNKRGDIAQTAFRNAVLKISARRFAECNYSGGTLYFPNFITEMVDHSFSAFCL